MVPHLISGVHVASFGTALAAAAILGVLNAILRPILILLTLPLTVLSLGLFLLIINAGLFELAGTLVTGFRVDSFGSAFLASLIVSIVSWVMNSRFERSGGSYTVVVRDGNRSQRRPTRTIDS
jgi:putative membrane protein